MPFDYRRGDVYEVWGVPVRGEPDARSVEKERFAVILQSDDLTKSQGSSVQNTIVIVPTTKDVTRASSTGLLVKKGTANLPRDSVILCDQIFTLKKAYCIARLGRLPDPIMSTVERRIQGVLGFPLIVATPVPPPVPAKPGETPPSPPGPAQS